MFKWLNSAVWILLAAGVALLLLPELGADPFIYNTYTTILKFYLFGVSAFFVLKRVAFHRMRGKVDVVRLVKKSDHQMSLLWHGALLGLVYLVMVAMFGNLRSFDTVLIGLILCYYFVLIFINGQPNIYLDEEKFLYDDFFAEKYSWKEIKRIELADKKIQLISPDKDFELDLDLVDRIDYRTVREEVELAVLDGEFTRKGNSKDLVHILRDYADIYDINIQKEK